MTEAPSQTRTRRRGKISCEFCSLRKLRCDRSWPCSNCVSRGKQCKLASSKNVQAMSIPAAADSTASPALTSPPAESRQSTRPPKACGSESLDHQHSTENLLAEVTALRKLAQSLEARVVQTAAPTHQRHYGSEDLEYSRQYVGDAFGSKSVSLEAQSAAPSPSVSRSDSALLSALTPVSEPGLNQVRDVMAHLEYVSRGRSAVQGPHSVSDMVFKIERIQAIPDAPAWVAQLGKLTPCVYLPLYAETKVLVERFISDVSYIQHILHHPTLSAAVDTVYRQVQGRETVQLGHLLLLISIIATVSHIWTPRDHSNQEGFRSDDSSSDSSPFLSPSQGHVQTPMWVKLAADLVNAAQNSASLTVETIQGIATLSFLISNLEGVSRRYRSLISTGLFLSRELGLHRIDHESNASSATDPVKAELGRRAWWYLVATDWLLALRYGGPGEGVYETHPLHMTVTKPRNINDIDLMDCAFPLERPASQATDMSYFLQRVRLAEISRRVVDPGQTAVTSPGRSGYGAHIMAMDLELDQMIRTMPPFFSLDRYTEGGPDFNTTSGGSIFIQAYMLNSVLYTQRCRLHLAYLTTGPTNNPAYASSRQICLQSACHIIRAETQLTRSGHSFVRIRLRLAAILYGIFVASIVLLMDACLNRPGSLQDAVSHGDVAEALRMIRDAKDHSLAAANLHESLLQIVAKYRTHHEQTLSRAASSTPVRNRLDIASSFMSPASHHVYRTDDTLANAEPGRNGEIISQTQIGSPLLVTSDGPSTSNELPAEDVEDLMILDGLQEWDDLFMGIESSSYFSF